MFISILPTCYSFTDSLLNQFCFNIDRFHPPTSSVGFALSLYLLSKVFCGYISAVYHSIFCSRYTCLFLLQHSFFLLYSNNSKCFCFYFISDLPFQLPNLLTTSKLRESRHIYYAYCTIISILPIFIMVCIFLMTLFFQVFIYIQRKKKSLGKNFEIDAKSTLIFANFFYFSYLKLFFMVSLIIS